MIFTSNYGEAGAIAVHGSEYGLPAPYSGHMSFADWGPPPDTATGPVLVVHPPDGLRLRRFFGDCRDVGIVDNGVGLTNTEQGTSVALCTGPTRPWSILWAELRHFY